MRGRPTRPYGHVLPRLLVMMVLVVPLVAQSSRGTINGIVEDATGAALKAINHGMRR